MDQSVTEEILNENSKLELKVLKALIRLEKKTTSSKRLKKKAGVTLMQIVKYLKATYRNLDGDIVTQVITALVQCIKNGLVCALDNGRYLHLGPQTKTMINNCFRRTVHGTRCSCAKKVPCPNACCNISVNISGQGPSRKRRCKRKKATTATTATTATAATAATTATTTTTTEAPKEEPAQSEKVETLCDNCFEIHPMRASQEKRTRTPVRKTFIAPFDTFSPRDEVNYNAPVGKVRKK